MPKMPQNVLYVPMMLLPIARCPNDRNMKNLQGLLSHKEQLLGKLVDYSYNGVNESILTEVRQMMKKCEELKNAEISKINVLLVGEILRFVTHWMKAAELYLKFTNM